VGSHGRNRVPRRSGSVSTSAPLIIRLEPFEARHPPSGGGFCFCRMERDGQTATRRGVAGGGRFARPGPRRVAGWLACGAARSLGRACFSLNVYRPSAWACFVSFLKCPSLLGFVGLRGSPARIAVSTCSRSLHVPSRCTTADGSWRAPPACVGARRDPADGVLLAARSGLGAKHNRPTLTRTPRSVGWVSRRWGAGLRGCGVAGLEGQARTGPNRTPRAAETRNE